MALRKPDPAAVPTLPSEIKTKMATERLATALRKANTTVYQRTIERSARALGYTGKMPRIADKEILASIRSRSRVSAESIVNTQQRRRAALIDEHGGKLAARPAYNAWHDGQAAHDGQPARIGQADRIENFEAGQTAAAATREFTSRNADVLQGEEWIEPGDSSGDAPCEDAIAQGRQPLGTIEPPPYHVSCVHSLSVAFDPVDDPSALWVGGESEEGA